MEPQRAPRRDKTLEELRRSEERFRLLVETVRDYAIFLLEPDGTVASWNAGAERIKGYKAGEIIGRHFSAFYPQADRESGKPERALRVAAAEGRAQDEGWRVRKDGTMFWALASLTALRDKSGELLGFAKVTRDLTERRAAEDRLRRSEERLRLMIDSVRDYAIFMLDSAGHVENWNPEARRVLGYDAEEILGRHFTVFFPREAVEAGLAARELALAGATGRYEDESWRVRKDGSRFWANVVISAIRSPAGELLGFTKVVRDLTERRAREEQLRAAMEELRKSNAELDEYAAFVSHDLQEPLRKMASFAQLVERRYRDKLDDDGRTFLAYIVDGASRMRALIVDVLEYARLGRGRPDFAPVALGEVVGQALGDLDVAVREAAAEVTVSPLPAVRGNARLLGRLAQNLLSNALKFRDPSRPLKVDVSAERVDGAWVLCVRDNGIGFEQGEADQILRPFARLHPKERYPGSGLGLSTVAKIAQLHGGRVWARSEPGKGAAFFVALPSEET